VSGPKNNSTASEKNISTASEKNISTTSGSNISTNSGSNISTTSGSNISTTSGNSVALKLNETIKCELCHKNAENLTPHVNGGKYCITCHGSQVHSIHTGEGTVNLECNTCHGSPPKIPVVEKGEGPGHYIVCENCHAAPPDNLKPSNGNLIVIHLSRSKYCTNCHGTDIGEIHSSVLGNATNSSNRTK
jgi:hypothetical protein